MEMVYTVYNTFVLIQALMERYIPIFRKNGEDLSSAWKWVGWGIGAYSLRPPCFVYLTSCQIAGLAGSLKSLPPFLVVVAKRVVTEDVEGPDLAR
ncbi:hypothetical protein SP40_6 [Salmonella phage 40]|nr:hypothetical protein SP40_6 [Salmonella phage 40]